MLIRPTLPRFVIGVVAAFAAVGCGGPAVPADGTDTSGADRADGGAQPDSPARDILASADATDDAPVRIDGTDVGVADSTLTDTVTPPPAFGCPALPSPTGMIVRVMPSQANQLPNIVSTAATGTTILLEDGTYRMTVAGEGSRRLNFRTAGVTIRSVSNDATRVILDGEYMTNEIINVVVSDVTLAHFTVMRAIDHPIHVYPGGTTGIRNVRLYGMRLIDGGEQFLKVNSNGADAWADDGRVECSFFQLTAAGRPHIERTPGGCYTGGIDTHGGRGWQVRLNRFEDMFCAGEGLAEHAIHFWVGSRDTVVENNTIVNCARGVGFGLVDAGMARTYTDNPYPGVSFIGHYDGVIRNNVIYATIPYFDTGIELAQARGARVFHNTVFTTPTATGFFSPIDYRFANTVVEIRNNLVSRTITVRNGAMGTLSNNLENVAAAYFANPAMVDFHLATGATSAIDRGMTVSGAGVDIDGDPHTVRAPDIGADERP